MPTSAAARMLANKKLRPNVQPSVASKGLYQQRVPLGSGLKRLVASIKSANPFSLKGTY